MRFENRIFLIILILYLAGFLAHAIVLGKTVYGDGMYYFAWLRSATVDRDADFRNEYAALGASQPLTKGGIPGNKYAVGPAMLWSVPYLTVRTATGGDGYGVPYQLAVGLTGVLAAIAGLILLHDALLTVFSRTSAAAAVAGIAFATNLLFYGSLDTVNSHAASFFAACIFVSYLARRKRPGGLTSGVLLGLVFLMRPQDTVYAVLLAPFVTLPFVLSAALGFAVAASAQLWAWQTLYGSAAALPYLSGGEGFSFLAPHILEALFSPGSGLYFWTPVLILGTVGAVLVALRHRRDWIGMIPVVLLLQLYLVASWSTWWQGASYGSRMFVSMLPLFAFGLGETFSRLLRYRMRLTHLMYLVIAPLSILNAVFIVYFLLRT